MTEERLLYCIVTLKERKRFIAQKYRELIDAVGLCGADYDKIDAAILKRFKSDWTLEDIKHMIISGRKLIPQMPPLDLEKVS